MRFEKNAHGRGASVFCLFLFFDFLYQPYFQGHRSMDFWGLFLRAIRKIFEGCRGPRKTFPMGIMGIGQGSLNSERFGCLGCDVLVCLLRVSVLVCSLRIP